MTANGTKNDTDNESKLIKKYSLVYKFDATTKFNKFIFLFIHVVYLIYLFIYLYLYIYLFIFIF